MVPALAVAPESRVLLSSQEMSDSPEATTSRTPPKCDKATQTVADQVSTDPSSATDNGTPVMSYLAFIRSGEKIEAIPDNEKEKILRELKQMDSVIEVRAFSRPVVCS